MRFPAWGSSPPRLVCRQHFRLRRFGFGFSRVDVDEGLSVGITNNVAAGHLVGTPWCGEDDLDAPDLAGQPGEGTAKAGNGLDREKVNGSGASGSLGAFAKSRSSSGHTTRTKVTY
jgi:hypothetical protein